MNVKQTAISKRPEFTVAGTYGTRTHRQHTHVALTSLFDRHGQPSTSNRNRLRSPSFFLPSSTRSSQSLLISLFPFAASLTPISRSLAV